MLGLDQVLSCASPLAVSILLCPSDNKVDCTHHSRTHPFALTAPRPAAMSACDCPTLQPLENSSSLHHTCVPCSKREISTQRTAGIAYQVSTANPMISRLLWSHLCAHSQQTPTAH